MQWETLVKGRVGKGSLCPARQPRLASSHRRMSVTDSSAKERTPKGEMPADNLLVHQPSSEVHAHRALSCGFQQPSFPFRAKSLLLTFPCEEGLAVRIKMSLNIWFNNCQGGCLSIALEFVFLAPSREQLVEPGVLWATNSVCRVTSPWQNCSEQGDTRLPGWPPGWFTLHPPVICLPSENLTPVCAVQQMSCDTFSFSAPLRYVLQRQ